MRFFSKIAILALPALGLSAVPPFDEWPSQRVQLEDVQLHFKYYGTGPPIVLLHGQPQHSLTWHTIAPALAEQNYSLIVPDQRGSGSSGLSRSGSYNATSLSSDLAGLLDFVNVTTPVFVVGHDLGGKTASSFAIEYPERVQRITVMDFALPGFGFEGYATNTTQNEPGMFNWQLVLFETPEVAEWLLRGREREFLEWMFWHISYQGPAVSMDHLDRYEREYTKPGYLRSAIEWYNSNVKDLDYFTAALNESPIQRPLLYLGGETGLANRDVWLSVGTNVTTDVIPKAGHWVGDENPMWTVRRLSRFFGEDKDEVPSVDLGFLEDLVTLV